MKIIVSIKLIALMSLLVLLVGSCKSYYLEENKPVWKSNESTPHPFNNIDTILKIVSYNIQESKNIELAIQELQNQKELENADIILLQEMDESGVINISKNLDLNYVYYPIAYYQKSKRNVGNAILSKAKIDTSYKIILPHQKVVDRGKRMSCSAVIHFGENKILVHSIHLETIAMSRKKRMEQLDHIIRDAQKDLFDHVIIGGDFNSMYKKDLKMLKNKFEAINYKWMSPDLGSTGSVPLDLLEPQLDHIFSKGFEVLDYGKCNSCEASDHKAIWSNLRLKIH